jgi:hypothetical protein
MNQEKRAWRAPELIDVGGVVELTEGMNTNVRDNEYSTMPPTWNPERMGSGEVDLEI